MASGDKYGAYQPYTVAPAWTTAKLADNVSLEDGATLPLAVTTAFIGLYDKLGLPEPTPDGKPAPEADKATVLVWGASSSVGAYVRSSPRSLASTLLLWLELLEMLSRRSGSQPARSSTIAPSAPR